MLCMYICNTILGCHILHISLQSTLVQAPQSQPPLRHLALCIEALQDEVFSTDLAALDIDGYMGANPQALPSWCFNRAGQSWAELQEMSYRVAAKILGGATHLAACGPSTGGRLGWPLPFIQITAQLCQASRVEPKSAVTAPDSLASSRRCRREGT